MTTALKGESKYPHINHSYIKDVDELKDSCLTNYEAGLQGKFYYMMQWMQNINFLAGNQWLKFNENSKEFEIEPNMEEESRITMNKVLPAFRLAVGSLLRDRMKPKVLQVNNDEESIDAAKVASKLLEHVARTNDHMAVHKEVIEWGAIAGKGIKKKWYDPEKDGIIDEVIQPFEFVTPANVRKASKMPWVCHARYETTEWVYENYGIEMEGNSEFGQYGSFLSAVKNVMDGIFFTGSTNTSSRNNVLIKEFWYRPCKKYPKGLLAIFAGDDLIYADKNPISGDDDDFYWPFTEMDFFDMPFRYWPMSLIEPMIDMQKYYNKFQSYALDSFKYAGMPTWWAQAGTVEQDRVIMEAGAINEYTGAHAPTPQVINPVSPQTFEVIDNLSSFMGEVVGIHQFGRGSMPPGVHAAAAMAIINEQDQINRMTISVNYESFIREDAKQTLYLVRKFWPNKSKIRVVGTEARWEVIDFDKSVLSGDEEITIESKQELAQDKMTRFDQVMKLMTTPRVDNPQEPILDNSVGLRILELEHEMETTSLRSLNWNMAKDENTKLAKGNSVQAFQWEDHKLHIEAHMEFMLRIEFKELPDKVQHAFMEHYQQHQMMLNGTQQSQGANASQQEQQQPQMGQQPMQGQMLMVQPPMVQPTKGMPQQMPPAGMQMPMQMGQGGMPMPPMQSPMQTASGLGAGLQQGMSNALGHAFGGVK